MLDLYYILYNIDLQLNIDLQFTIKYEFKKKL